jgi:hypothetical protein
MLPTRFLSDVLPTQGSRIFCFILPGQPGQRPTVQFDQMAGVADAEVERYAQWAISKGADSYVAIAGYGAQVRIVTQGKNAGQQRVSRTQTNALWHRCLRLDIDCGAGKPYPTRKDAWDALKPVLAANALPLPTLVNSGNGLHVYFLFDRDVDLTTWAALSTLLRNACMAGGLHVDPTTTEDAARILRLPGTYNFKGHPALPVVVVKDGVPTDPLYYDQQLAKYALLGNAQLPTIAGTRPSHLGRPVNPMAANLHPPYSLRGVLVGCPGLTAKVVDKGAYDSEPLWHATLALINKSDNAPDVKERVARNLSIGHPGFTEGAFQAKWAQVQQQDYEPPTCEKFASLGMPQCTTCPLRVTHKSPVVLGRAQPQPPQHDAQAAVPLQVAPVLQQAPLAALVTTPVAATQHGIFMLTPGMNSIAIVDGPLSRTLSIHNGVPTVMKLIPNQQGGSTPVNSYIGGYQITAAERLLDAEGKMAIVALTFHRFTDGDVRVEFTHREMSEARAFQQHLAANGLHYNANDVKLLQDKFMPEFLSQLQRIRQANTIAGKCGWTPDFNRFVLGTNMYSTAGVESIRSSSSQSEMDAYHQRGSEQDWTDAFNMVLAGGADRQAIVALGLAAPLMAFSGVDGVLLNAYSPQSGVGKSTLCDAILSIWGSPDRLRKDFRDTAAATFHLAAVSGNLPMVIDEFTNVEGKELSNYIYTITQGREKHRLGADSRLRDNPNRWCLPAIATSNLSVHAKLQNYRQDAIAEAARVFEMRLFPLNVDPSLMGAAKAKIDHLKHNYGFLGPRIVQLLMSQPETYWRAKMMARIAWWDKEMAVDTSDRFRSVVAALMDIGAAIGKAMGYNFDRDAIITEVKRHWHTQVEEYEQARMKPEDFITAYIADNINRIVVYGGETGDQLVGNIDRDYAGEIHTKSQRGMKPQVQSIRIPMKNIKQYVADRNADFKAVLEWMNNEPTMVGRIGSMTFLPNTPRCIRLNGVEFTPAVLGHATLQLVGDTVSSVPVAAVAP